MSDYRTGDEAAKEVCAILGLDTKEGYVSFNVSIAVGEPVTVTIKRLLTYTEIERINRILARSKVSVRLAEELPV